LTFVRDKTTRKYTQRLSLLGKEKKKKVPAKVEVKERGIAS